MYMYMVDKAGTMKAKEIHKFFYFHDKKKLRVCVGILSIPIIFSISPKSTWCFGLY